MGGICPTGPYHEALIGPEQFDPPSTPFAVANIRAVSSWNLAGHAVQVGGFHASQLQKHSSPWLRISASLPALMTPSQTPRMHWSERQQQRQEKYQRQTQQQPAPQLPLERAAANDIIDVLEACGSHAQ